MDSDKPKVPFKFINGDHHDAHGVLQWISAEQEKVRAKSRSLPPPFLIVMYQKFPRHGVVRRLADAGAYVLKKPAGFDAKDLATRRQMIEKLLEARPEPGKNT